MSIDDENILFLDCTRLEGSKKLVSRNNTDCFDDVEKQIKRIADELLRKGNDEIILADDVVFSGTVLKTVTEEFKKNGVQVIGIRSAIAMRKSYEMFKDLMNYGIKSKYLLGDKVIDQVCERDFYFGIAQSGISVMGSDGFIYKSPYFVPFGDPVLRASVPEMYKSTFSQGCIRRSIALWSEIERLSKKEIDMSCLPEKIVGVGKKERVVKILKKELR